MSNEVKYYSPLFTTRIPLEEIDALTEEIMSSDPFRKIYVVERLQEASARIVFKISHRRSLDFVGEIRLLMVQGQTVCNVMAPPYPDDEILNEEIIKLLLSGDEINAPVQISGGKATIIPVDRAETIDSEGMKVRDFQILNHEYDRQIINLKQAIQIYVDGLKQAIQLMDITVPENGLTYLEERIIEAVETLRDKGLLTTDEAVSLRLPASYRGEPYTREWVNRMRNEMRKKGINV